MILDELACIRDDKANAIIYNSKYYTYEDFKNQISAAYQFLSPLKKGSYRTLCVVQINNLHMCWITLIALRALGFNTVAIDSIEQIQKLTLKKSPMFFSQNRKLNRADLSHLLAFIRQNIALFRISMN